MAPDEKGRLRTLIIDDERLARDNLRDLLAGHQEMVIVGEARHVREAEAIIENTRPDVIFLDIQMPGGSGFDLLERLVCAPPVIFVTAFDQYAIRAFEVNALDYLLKPVKKERLARVIALQKTISRELMREMLGTEEVVLVEGVSKRSSDEVLGRTDQDMMAVFSAPESRIGSFARVRLDSVRGNTFKAVEVS